MIRIAVVDDDNIMLEKICVVIRRSMGEEIILDTFESSTVFFQNISSMRYDIVFLDIDMPAISGFEIAKALKCLKPEITIIFVSNLEHLVFQSFEFKPLRFVRKSRLKEDISSAVNAYHKEISQTKDVYFFRTSDIERSVMISDIIYFESMGHDIYIQTIDDRFKLKRDRKKEVNMKILTDQFQSQSFIRVHKSFLLNCRYIYVINRNCIVLKNNAKMYINPHRVNEIKSLYQKFLMMEG